MSGDLSDGKRNRAEMSLVRQVFLKLNKQELSSCRDGRPFCHNRHRSKSSGLGGGGC